MSKQDVYYTEEQWEIADRWRPLVQAAGLDSPQHDPGNTFMLATAILHDTEVCRRAFAKADGVVIPDGARLQVLKEMTPGELEALRVRIVRKYKAKVVQP